MAWLGGWFDPELDELFRDEPDLRETATRLRAAHPEPVADPRFRNRLRAQLMAEAAGGVSPGRWRRRWRLGPAPFAVGGAVAGVALIAATVFTFTRGGTPQGVVAYTTNVAAQHQLSPSDVITVSFNQTMDEPAVEAGVHIQPATAVTYTWQGNNLVITPVHHLAGNTPYSVTIDQNAVRSSAGTVAAAPINITFGTAPTPPPGPGSAAPPVLVPMVLGQTSPGGGALFAPDGSVISTQGVAPATSGTPSASAGSSASASPGSEGLATPPLGAFALLQYPASGGPPAVIGQAGTAVAFAPNHRTLASAVDDGSGGSQIVVSQSDGSDATVLVRSATPVTALAWSANDRLVYTDGTEVIAVDLTGASHSLLVLPPGTGTVTTIAPRGGHVYVAPPSSSGGLLVNLEDGTQRILSGAISDVSFSGDGSTIAWVDQSGSRPVLETEPVGRDAPAKVLTLDPTAGISHLTLDDDGNEAAYLLSRGSGSAQVVVAQLPNGTPLAVGTTASAIALSAAGDSVAYVTNGADGPVLERAPVPGVSAATQAAELPPGASSALRAFVDAQIASDRAQLTLLSAAGVDAAAGTPRHLSRAYIISTVTRPDGTVSAGVELVVDPTPGHAASVESETLRLATSDGGAGYLVTSIAAGPLHTEASGPHVVHISAATVDGVTVVEVVFDSDLDQGSVRGAITVMDSTGVLLVSSADYDVDTRTATVTLAGTPAGSLTVLVGTSLRDINGESPAAGFSASVAAS